MCQLDLGRIYGCPTGMKLTNRLVLFAVLVSICWSQAFARKSQPGDWKTQKELNKLMSATDFTVAVVVYTDSQGALSGSHAGDVFLKAAVELKTFQISSYKIKCSHSSQVEPCKSKDKNSLPAIYIYQGSREVLLTPSDYPDHYALVSRAAQTLLTQFNVGSGHLLQVVSRQAELQRVYKWNDEVVVMAMPEWFNEVHSKYLEALYFFLNSRHGYKLKMALTTATELCEIDECDDSQGPGVLWAKHFRGEAHQNSFNVYRGGFDQKGILSFLFGSSLPPLLTPEELLEDDGRLMTELDVHCDFGLTLAFLATSKQSYTNARKLMFTTANEQYRGNIAGAFINIRNKALVSRVPEVQSYLDAAENDTSIRKPLVILRGGAHNGKRLDPAVVFELKLENLENAYEEFMPKFFSSLPRPKKMKGTKPKAEPEPAPQPIEPVIASPAESKPYRKEEGMDTEVDIETMEFTGKYPSPEAAPTNEDEEEGSGHTLIYEDPIPTPTIVTNEDNRHRQGTKEILVDGVKLIVPDEDKDDEASDTTDDGYNHDDVARLSQSIARLTHLLRISPAAYVPFLKRKDAKTLHKLAPLVTILYHTPYTASSRVFRVVFSDVMKQFRDRKDEVAFIAIDCSQLSEICRDRRIPALPSVGFLTHSSGEISTKHKLYQDEMDFNTLIKAVRGYIRPTVKQVSSREELINIIATHYGSLYETIAVALLSPGHLKEYSVFADMAVKLKGRFIFVAAVGELLSHLMERHNAKLPAIIVIKPRDIAEHHALYSGNFEEKALRKFFKSLRNPKMGPLTVGNGGELLNDGRTLFVYIGRTGPLGNITSKSSKEMPRWKRLQKTMKTISLEVEFQHRFMFLWMRKDVPGFAEIAQTLMLDKSEAVAVIIDRKADAVFEFSGSPSTHKLRTFLRDYEQGQLFPTGHLLHYKWSNTEQAFDFLTKARQRWLWEEKAKLKAGKAADDGTISLASMARSRVRTSRISDDELTETDEIEIGPTTPRKLDSNTGRSDSDIPGRRHDEL